MFTCPKCQGITFKITGAATENNGASRENDGASSEDAGALKEACGPQCLAVQCLSCGETVGAVSQEPGQLGQAPVGKADEGKPECGDCKALKEAHFKHEAEQRLSRKMERVKNKLNKELQKKREKYEKKLQKSYQKKLRLAIAREQRRITKISE